MTDNSTLEYETYEIGFRETVVLRRGGGGGGGEWKRMFGVVNRVFKSNRRKILAVRYAN